MADIFISYKREDRRIAERLSISLEQLGFDVWWDFEILSGQQFRRVIEQVIDQCGATLVLWSQLSRDSTFVVDEATYAREQGKLCPARIDDCRLPLGFGGDHVVDLRDWDGEMGHTGLQDLLRALEGKTGKKARLGARARANDEQARFAEMEAFKVAQAAENVSALRSFLRDYPAGLFANFVRGQLEEMEARAPKVAAGAAAPPPRPEPATPRFDPPPQTPLTASMPTAAPVSKQPPWPLIAGGALAVALVAVVFALRPWNNPVRPELEQPAAVEEARDVTAQIEAARRDERERVEQENAAGQAQRDQSARAEADDNAWAVAQRANTFAGYDAYLSAYPLGRHAADARSSRQRLSAATNTTTTVVTTSPFELAALHPDVRAVVERARDSERRALAAAARARDVAALAQQNPVDTPESGLGYYQAASGNHQGDRYDGEFRGGAYNGVGVVRFGENANSRQYNGLRYEGQFVNNQYNGVGVHYWRDGLQLAGAFENMQPYLGVRRYPDGSRYEGEEVGGARDGYGVSWDAQGRVINQGIWSNGTLATPLSR